MQASLQMRALLLVVVCSCSGAAEPGEDEPRIPEYPTLRLELVYAVAHPGGGAVIGGLSGAADPGVTVELGLGAETTSTAIASPLGRFRMRLEAAAGERVWIRTAGLEPIELRVRDPARALAEAVRVSEGSAGSVPNDLIALEGSRAVLVRSGDDALSLVDPALGVRDEDRSIRLPQGSNPWFAAAAGDGSVAVSGFGDDRIYLLDLEQQRVERALVAEQPVRLETPFVLSRAIDLDGDGIDEREIEQLMPRAPQPVLVLGGRVFAVFSGFVDAGQGALPPVYLPSVLASWPLDSAEAPRLLVLPSLNAQELRAAGDQVLVVCSGVLDVRDGHRPLTPGAVLLVDPVRLEVSARLDLPDFAPGSAVLRGSSVWMSSLVRPELLQADLQTGEELQRLVLNDEPLDSIFRLVELQGGLLGAPSFNTDRLHVIDPELGLVNPEPFFAPIVLGPGRPIFDGLQIVTRRPGRAGADFTGPDLFVLSGIASRLRTVELRKVLGP